MSFSLIVASVDRTLEINKLFKSLAAQTYLDFEVILVDQNLDQRLLTLVNEFSSYFKITHLHCERGLSRARNAGILAAKGDIVAFPDDDAFYPLDFFERLNEAFSLKANLSGITGRCLDSKGKIAAAACDKYGGTVNSHNVWNRGVATTLFLRRDTLKDVGGFDELLGLGAPTSYHSGEETDLILRIISKNHTIEYDPDLIVFHPSLVQEGREAVYKAWSYGLGMGRVLKKHRINLFTVSYHVLYPFFGAVTAFATGYKNKAHIRLARCTGRFYGWKSSKSTLIHHCPQWIKQSAQKDKLPQIISVKKTV